MNENIFIVVVYYFIFIIIIINGLVMYLKEIKMNYTTYGRTKLGLKNRENWNYVNKLTGKHFIIISVIFFIPFIVSTIFFELTENFLKKVSFFCIFPYMILLLVSLMIVERKVKKFDELNEKSKKER